MSNPAIASTSPRRPEMSVMLTAKDVAASISFYRDKLGFELESTWPNEQAPLWASVKLNGQSIMLGCEATEASDCGGAEGKFYLENTAAFHKAAGGGIMIYIEVEDVDAYHAELLERGAEPVAAPRNEFYGLRDFPAYDPDGYRLYFFQPIKMESCQSCGMPLADAHPGQMYCAYCTDESGKLKPYEAVFEGTVVGYFMGMQKLEREAAEVAARELLAKMPAWAGHC